VVAELCVLAAGKKSGGKARDESMIDKKHELEKRLENVKGALGAPSKKPPKKGLNLKQPDTNSNFWFLIIGLDIYHVYRGSEMVHNGHHLRIVVIVCLLVGFPCCWVVPDMTYNVFGGTLNPTLLTYHCCW